MAKKNNVLQLTARNKKFETRNLSGTKLNKCRKIVFAPIIVNAVSTFDCCVIFNIRALLIFS